MNNMNLYKNVLIKIIFMLIISNDVYAMEYIIDMVHNNPGEKPYDTKYNDPVYVKSLGFNGMVPQWHVNSAITYLEFDPNLYMGRSEELDWIEKKAKSIDVELEKMETAGMNVYPFVDFVVFPNAIWDKYGDMIKRDDGSVGYTMGGDGRKNIPDIRKPLSEELVRQQVISIFERFPEVDGLVLRFGETYLFDTPFHSGGSPIRIGRKGVEDHINLIRMLREEICVKRNKKLFYRTWDWGDNFHNNEEYYLAVTDKVKPHKNLIFSIKYQQDDFLRMTPFNPTIGKGRHQQIVEAQSRMEAYGKGAHPYYSAIGVINGWPETRYKIVNGYQTNELQDVKDPRGVKDVLSSGVINGVFTWSHGGGWKGPYIKHEIWTDLNTFVVSQWARDPSKTEEQLFYEFAKNVGLTGSQADIFRQIAILSVEGVRKGQHSSYTINNKWWSRDQYFSVAANSETLSHILENKIQAQVLSEKREATAIWLQIEALSQQLQMEDEETLKAIRVSSTYGRIKYALIEQMWILMIEDSLGKSGKELNSTVIENAIAQYDLLWDEWIELERENEYSATLYTDLAFKDERKGSIGELVDKLR
jgi:hypothetical protein